MGIKRVSSIWQKSKTVKSGVPIYVATLMTGHPSFEAINSDNKVRIFVLIISEDNPSN